MSSGNGYFKSIINSPRRRPELVPDQVAIREPIAPPISRNSHDFYTARAIVKRLGMAIMQCTPSTSRDTVNSCLATIFRELKLTENNEDWQIMNTTDVPTNCAFGKYDAVFRKVFKDAEQLTQIQKQYSQGVPYMPSYRRYENDFVHIGLVGKGAFGSVYKARSKVDNCSYALKRIEFKSISHNPYKIMNEVQLMAQRGTHPHIVRYYGSWTELEVVESPLPLSANASSTSTVSAGVSVSVSVSVQPVSDEEDGDISDSYNPSFAVGDSEQENQKQALQKSKFFGVHSSMASSEPEQSESVAISVQEPSSSSSTESERSDQNNPQQLFKQVLYIQMELCKTSLDRFLRERNEHLEGESVLGNWEARRALIICTQLMRAVQFLHQNGVIHRDIKPSNLLVASDDEIPLIKVADFGLACISDPITNEPENMGPSDLKLKRYEVHTQGIGTSVYAPNEQIHSKHYDISADIFSCGIVIFEVFSIFHTDSERLISIDNLRKGRTPDTIRQISNELFDVISAMVCKDPAKRPNAEDVLAALTDVAASISSPLAIMDCSLSAVDLSFPRECPDGCVTENGNGCSCRTRIRTRNSSCRSRKQSEMENSGRAGMMSNPSTASLPEAVVDEFGEEHHLRSTISKLSLELEQTRKQLEDAKRLLKSCSCGILEQFNASSG